MLYSKHNTFLDATQFSLAVPKINQQHSNNPKTIF